MLMIGEKILTPLISIKVWEKVWRKIMNY